MGDMFRPFFRSVEDRVANRREQLRKAQKTFKERRDQYLRMLEQQVKRLQLTESQLQTTIDRLQRELFLAKSELMSDRGTRKRMDQYDAGGGYAPAAIFPGEGEPILSATSTLIWVEAQDDKPYQMHVQSTTSQSSNPTWPLTHVTEMRPSPRESYASHLNEPHHKESGGDAQALGSRDRSSVLENSQALVAQLDGVIVAMEFVLKLERPCLPHVCQPGDDSSAPHGHVHTATAALLCNAPSSDISSCTSWSAPTEVLSRLLDMSTDLPIEGSELTPIQVWHQIKETPNFSKISIHHLTFLSDKLLSHMKCYGFGAVVRKEYLAQLLSGM